MVEYVMKQSTDQNQQMSGRSRRALAARRSALSPVRILLMVLMLPLTTLVIAVGVYMRTTEYEPTDAVVHLLALAGCDAVSVIHVGPFRHGEAGYHARNDTDGDGTACGDHAVGRVQSNAPARTQTPKQRTLGTAKFVRP